MGSNYKESGETVVAEKDGNGNWVLYNRARYSASNPFLKIDEETGAVTWMNPKLQQDLDANNYSINNVYSDDNNVYLDAYLSSTPTHSEWMNAIDDCITDKKTLVLPPGTTELPATLDLMGNYSHADTLRIIGQGNPVPNTHSGSQSTIDFKGSGAAFDALNEKDYAKGIRLMFENFELRTDVGADTTGVAQSGEYVGYHSHLFNFGVTGFDTGIKLENIYGNNLTSVSVRNCVGNGIVLGSTGNGPANAIDLVEVRLAGNDVNIVHARGHTINIIGGNNEGASSWGLSSIDDGQITVMGTYFENTSANANIKLTANNASFYSPFIGGASGKGFEIYSGAGAVSIHDPIAPFGIDTFFDIYGNSRSIGIWHPRGDVGTFAKLGDSDDGSFAYRVTVFATIEISVATEMYDKINHADCAEFNPKTPGWSTISQ